MKEERSLSHARCDCKYRAVFIAKRREKVLFEALHRYLGGISRELAQHKEAQVVEGYLKPDMYLYYICA